MAIHGNSKLNTKPHHLYEIRDSVDDDVFKYGISHDPVDADGYSNRMRHQVDLLNLGVKWERFFARMLVLDIEGRAEAWRVEREYIDRYRAEHGYPPRGNRDG
jgi:hypothetical protein